MAIKYRFLVRGGTAADLTAVNEIPLARELCYETDTGKGKLGDGVTTWNALPYLPGAGGGGGAGTTWHHGSGVPSGGLGVDGDMYLDVDTGDVYTRAAGVWTVTFALGGALNGQIIFGAGDRINAIAIGAKAEVPVMFDGEIEAMQIRIATTDGLPGNISVDIWKCSYANASATRPDVTDSIVAAAPPTISGGSKAQDITLVGWTKSFAAGDVFLPVVVGRSANVSYYSVALKIRKNP